ncbi:MAG: anaerobic ribonucleoside triphosphate reductase [Christensenellaceae bacterium]|jgi:ribonucleoside-triphosphate reductase|nr:anaerobic ribonucleoside triphosphate reductase [Christensenellaceae bacterium]
MYIIKRDGTKEEFKGEKILAAIQKAVQGTGIKIQLPWTTEKVATAAINAIQKKYSQTSPSIEDIQNMVEETLIKTGNAELAKRYILYRQQKTIDREKNSSFMNDLNDIMRKDASESDSKRENANIDSNTAMGTMLKIGVSASKKYYELKDLDDDVRLAFTTGDIHIHDFEFYEITTTCCQIDLIKLFHNGFSTGHGFLREPSDISSYAALACIAIQSNQNDQHGGQSIPNFDYAMAIGVAKTYKKLYRQNFAKAIEILKDAEENEIPFIDVVSEFKRIEEECGESPRLEAKTPIFDAAEAEYLIPLIGADLYKKARAFALKFAVSETDRATFQAMEAFIHNLNTMHSRAGAQTPFSSINFGTDTSAEGRMLVRNLLAAEERGLGNGETPIFPIQIFKVKEGINYNKDDKNYDLFKQACKVSSKRMFPNFAFIDAPYNLQYYKPGRPETEVAYMGCRTRVIGNTYDPSNEIVYGRGNLSFTSVNLPRLAINAHGETKIFYDDLQSKMELVLRQLLSRLAFQSKKKVKNFPFLMGQGIWLGSDNLTPETTLEKVLKQGTLSIGFIGLAEALIALTGYHHGENADSRALGLEIIRTMREFCDKKSKEYDLNITLLGTPAEGLSGTFIRKDKHMFGEIPGITDREFYTNSFHIPVYYPISVREKIEIEAPYHALTNAGHISYVELDGDLVKNTEAFESIIRCMKENNIGYGSVNHPIDRDPVCGYTGIIEEGKKCPKCKRVEADPLKATGEKVEFERIRRITGYLVGTLSRFNNAKFAEVKARVKHKM